MNAAELAAAAAAEAALCARIREVEDRALDAELLLLRVALHLGLDDIATVPDREEVSRLLRTWLAETVPAPRQVGTAGGADVVRRLPRAR